MDIRKVKKLIELLEESNIDEIEIKEGEESVRISRNGGAMAAPMPAPMAYAPPAPVAPAPAPAAVEARRQRQKCPPLPMATQSYRLWLAPSIVRPAQMPLPLLKWVKRFALAMYCASLKR